MNETLRSVLIGTLPLDAVFFVAAALTITRRFRDAGSSGPGRAVAFASIALASQSLHFLEEYLTEFYTRFPELLGIAEWPEEFFVGFNVAWIAVWSASIAGITRKLRIALLPLWFLGIALIANAVAHLGFSLVTGGYFPGLLSVPLVAFTGIMLVRELAQITRSATAAPDRLDQRYWGA